MAEVKPPTPTHKAPSRVLVLGVGNPLRADDGIGLLLVDRIAERFGPRVKALTLFAPDPTLSEELAETDFLVVIDAYYGPLTSAYTVLELKPTGSLVPEGGFVSHIFDWGTILTVARELFGGCPEAVLVGVRAGCFDIRESVSPSCMKDAEEAYEYLVGLISERL